MAGGELILSEHENIIDFVSVLDISKVYNYDNNEPNQPWLPAWSWFYCYHMRTLKTGTSTRAPTFQLMSFPPTSEAGGVYNADKSAQIYCLSCEIWYYVDSLDTVEDKYREHAGSATSGKSP
ncbi:hypothetical protein K435DRAFT_861917 [Dendrothele bispora CBS 962.96]|uniref:Uncharacterized protein n=1 Tax=Dendrothele bispora (strain CBS 962.96) TaxID=1314807 RepID=A0A4S8LVD2_DENBC|nr:hypothetical protein K435DRAFT_861917 [Dendrothele bispora CBS 962.96]